MVGRTASASLAPPEPIGEDLISHWMLDRSIAFLNHGCFGATPSAVLEAQSAWRKRIESRPVELLDRRREDLLAVAKEAVGRFIGARPRDFGFVTNATGGVNAVLRSLRFGPGDELLTTNHVYKAVQRTLGHVAARSGAKLVEVEIPLPVPGPDAVVQAITRALGAGSRLLVIDHITSPTAVLFPIERILTLCAARDVDVLVDGAHAPGMIELDIEGLKPAYYAANLHKWVCAPKGSALLWVRPDRQSEIRPNTISNFFGEGFEREFGWQGTRDITAWLCGKEAIELMAGFDWSKVRRHNHELATWAQATLSRRWGVEPTTPLDGSMLGAMAAVALPEGSRRHGSVEALGAELYRRYRIEVPVIEFGGRWWVRVSCQIYNTAEQYERLADAVLELARNS